jgi:hypothetical protein
MTTSYPAIMPRTDRIKSLRLGRRVAVGANKSPFTYQRQVFQWPGDQWFGELSLVPLAPCDAGPFHAFFTSLDGPVGTFLLGDPLRQIPLGTAAGLPGTPVVNGAGQVGETLNIRGLPASRPNYLLAGDYVQLGTGITTRLYLNLQTVASDASGQASLTLRPRVKVAPADGATVTVRGTRGIWTLVDSDYSWLADATALAMGVTVAIVEPR